MSDIEELEKLDKLKTKVLKYIMYKKRTEKEVRRKFSEEDQDLLEDVIENLKENGYINDKSYVERAVAEFMNLNNLSLKELKYKLQSKGVDSKALEEYMDIHQEELEEYEVNSAKKIILKKQNSMEEQALIQYLLKKGYRTDLVKEAITSYDLWLKIVSIILKKYAYLSSYIFIKKWREQENAKYFNIRNKQI